VSVDSASPRTAPAAAGTDPYLSRPFVVRRVRREAPQTSTLTLEPLDGRPLLFRAGQFTMLGRPGYGEVPISVSGDPVRPERLVHTVRAVGEASGALVECTRGDLVLVRGPYGRGWDIADAEGGDVLVVAGGIGLAPLRPALLQVIAGRERYGRVVLVYGSRSPDQLLYRHQIEQWRGRFDLEVAVTVDAAAPGWRGQVGLVTTLLPHELDPASTMAFVCGPEIMMRLAADAMVDRGLLPGRVRVSMERNMKCGIGLCGHCQLRELFICTDGPVLGYDRVRPLLVERGL
jgi:NAD(P)H-flavin reductase